MHQRLCFQIYSIMDTGLYLSTWLSQVLKMFFEYLLLFSKFIYILNCIHGKILKRNFAYKATVTIWLIKPVNHLNQGFQGFPAAELDHQ